MARNPFDIFGQEEDEERAGLGQIIETDDGRLHVFAHNTPSTDLERFQWRYNNGQDTSPNANVAPAQPKHSFSDAGEMKRALGQSGSFGRAATPLQFAAKNPLDIQNEAASQYVTNEGNGGLYASNSPGYVQRASDSTRESLKVQRVSSDAGRDFMKGWEDYVDHIKPDQAGNPSFGYGHKLTDSDQELSNYLAGMTAEKKQWLANAMFNSDLVEHERRLRRLLGANAIDALNQNQYDALVAATFNGGVGPRMIAAVKAGDYEAAAREFNANYVTNPKTRAKEFSQGLANRNAALRNVFVNGDYSGRP